MKFFILLISASFSIATIDDEPSREISTIVGSFWGIQDNGESLWELENRGKVLTDIKNINIQHKIQTLYSDTLMILPNSLERDVIAESINDLDKKINLIENYYEDMVRYYQNHQSLSASARDKMMVNCHRFLQDDFNNPMNTLNQTMDMLAFKSSNVLDVLKSKSQNSCLMDTSRKSIYYILYKYFELTEYLKSKMYLTLKIAFVLLNQYEPDDSMNIHLSYRKMVDLLIINDEKIRDKFKTVLQDTSRNLWRNDPEPKDYEKDSTYTQLNHVFVGHIRSLRNIQEVSSPSCPAKSTCSSENPTKEKRCYSFASDVDPNSLLESLLCQKQRKCAGKLWNCQQAFKDWNVTLNICLSHPHSQRSYNFIKASNRISSVHYGSYSKCEEPMVYQYSKNMENELLPLMACDVCYCICDDDLDYETMRPISERLFFKGLSESDVSLNYVVTGARIRKYFGIIYVQIQQGQLLENGKINQSSIDWREEYYNDLTNPRKHFKLHWRARSIELQDIDIPYKNILVGFSFENVTKDGVERLRLVALSRPFNYTSGKLSLEKKKSDKNRAEASSDGIEIHDLKLPDSSKKNEIIVSNKYLNFSISNFDTDLGQSTIPFIDIQDVTLNEPFPMSGVGLYYKKSYDDDVAGFIGLKLKTYDFSRRI